MVSAEGYPWNTNPPKVVVKGVKIGDVPCEITRVEPTVLYIAISPDGSGGGMRFTGMSIIAVTGPHSAGICDVEVVMAVNGAEVNVSLPGGFTYVGDQVEVGKIVRVVPKEGPAEGGTDVTIALQLAQYSVGWYGLTNVDEVKIGGVACKVEGFGAYRHPGGFYIKAVTGAHPAGVCDVEATIRVADHTTRVTEATLVLPGGFTYKEKFEVITGVVRNDLVAIGGETTGWAIGETEVFPHPDLEKYLGQLVQATGRFEPHDYLERGRVQIFRIEKIEPAPR